MKRPIAFAILLGVVCAAAGFGGGWWFGDRDGRKDGFAIGKRYAEVQAAKRSPIPVLDEGIDLARLTAAGVFDGTEGPDDSALVQLLNRAPSPCEKYARRGLSLARSLVDPEASCGLEGAQVSLARAALHSFDSIEEAIAVLRVERRMDPDITGRPRRGNPDAAVVLVEYSDFQCPYCVRAHDKITKLMAGRDDIALVYKHLPLRMHPAAVPAAIAAEAAAEQGKFWEMHDALFALGKKIGDGVDGSDPVPAEGSVYYEAQAEAIGLDLEQYRADFRSDLVRDRVDDDAEEADRLGVRGTPTFVLGGARTRPGPSSDRLSRQIARAQSEAAGQFSWDLPPLPPGVDPADAAPADATPADATPAETPTP